MGGETKGHANQKATNEEIDREVEGILWEPDLYIHALEAAIIN